MIRIRRATREDALFIAKGFHTAMLMEDVPEEQTLLFARNICMREDVLYSWRNTIIAEQTAEHAAEPVGMLTAYDGKHYPDWRRTTMSLVREYLGVEFPGMEDEAAPGEYYLDSLAILPQFRGQGIGTMLLRHGIRSGQSLGLDITLAVDPVNARAQRLYSSLGFLPDGELFIFGHTYWKMKIPATKKMH